MNDRGLVREIIGHNDSAARLARAARPPPDMASPAVTAWGNSPQTHAAAGLLLSAVRSSRSWEDRYWRG
jgi:hypothetical protein